MSSNASIAMVLRITDLSQGMYPMDVLEAMNDQIAVLDYFEDDTPEELRGRVFRGTVDGKMSTTVKVHYGEVDRNRILATFRRTLARQGIVMDDLEQKQLVERSMMIARRYRVGTILHCRSSEVSSRRIIPGFRVTEE